MVEKDWPTVFFLAKRSYPYLRLERNDSNLFFQALMVQFLDFIKLYIPDKEFLVLDERSKMIREHYADFRQDINGLPIYQFWKIGKQHHFPNGNFLHRFKKFKSPPDLDDTSLAYLTKPHSTSEVIQLRDYLQKFANGIQKFNKKVPRPLNLPLVYSTWMGTGRMPIEFDVVVLSNFLRLLLKHHIPWNSFDLASISYLEKIVKDNYYVYSPFMAAPWYPNPILIYYHLVKLVFVDKKSFPDGLVYKLQKDFSWLQKHTNGVMDELLLQISGLRIGIKNIKMLEFPGIQSREVQDFSYYIGGMLTATQSKWIWPMARSPIFHWRFQCTALTVCLWLEYYFLYKEAIEGKENPIKNYGLL